ncbi:hypothetical protein D3C76_846270 [compost metagenome]
MQRAGADLALEAGRRQRQGLQRNQARAVALQGHDRAGQLQRQVGEAPVGGEQDVPRPAAGRCGEERRLRRLQRPVAAFGLVAIGEHLVGAEVGGEQEVAVRRHRHRMRVPAGLAVGVDAAAGMRLGLHHRAQGAGLADAQHRQRTLRQGRVVGDEQVAPVRAEAAVGGLVALGFLLVDLVQRAAGGVEAERGDPAAGIAARGAAVLVEHEQHALVGGEAEERRIGRARHAERAVQAAEAAVEAVQVDALAARAGVGAHQQMELRGLEGAVRRGVGEGAEHNGEHAGERSGHGGLLLRSTIDSRPPRAVQAVCDATFQPFVAYAQR